MQAQSVTLDFLKPVGTVVDLSDKFNARVGDSMTPFNLFVTEGGKPKALNGLHPELEAAVGDGELKDGKAVMSDNAKGIHWVGNADNVTGYNRLTLTFPAEVFPQSGFCYGHLILANDAGVRESSVDIWFKVLDGLEIMGLAADYYDSAIELELKKLKEANSQAEQRLSKMKATPEGFANLDDLKAKYPVGNANLNVTVDDGHLWIWLNGGWRDCGQYQTPALDSEKIKRIQVTIAKLQQQFAERANKIRQNSERIIDHQAELDINTLLIKRNQTGIQNIEGVGSLKDIELTDQNGNHIADSDGNRLSGQRWLINTDKTLSQPDLPADAKAVGEALITYGNRVSNHEQRLGDDDIRIKDNQTRVENIEGVGSLKDIELTDQDGNYLTDGSGVRIGGKRWLINTDKTLTQTDLPADAKAVGEALVTKPDNYDLPILYLYGAGIEGMKSKKDSLSEGLSFSFPRFNVSGTLTGIKVQGASSAGLAKKNYTLHLDRKIELIPGYGKQKKYVIKADMTDFSHVRNVGCAKLWGEVRKTRIKADDAIKVNDTDYLTDNTGNHITGEADPQLSIGGNYGAVDGFPIALYINDKYWGLYSFNVPKDAWMAKMSSHSKDEAIVSTDWTALDKAIRLDGTDMEIEFCGTKNTAWVFSSINALIDALKASYTTKEAFDQAIDKHLDVDSAIDYYVYSAAIGNTDGVLRNYLFQTWNRTKWYIAAYDLDMTFGRTPDLPDWLSPVYNGDNNRRGGTTLTNLAGGNRLFHQLWKFHKEDIITRYKELVAGPLSSGAVSTLLTNFAAPIPDALLSQEDKTWPQTQLSGTNNLSQIRWWYMEHINFLTNSIVNA